MGNCGHIQVRGEENKVASISIATEYKRKDGTSVTSWHDCRIFGKSVEVAEKYISKGTVVYVTGSIEYDDYEDKNGNKQHRAFIRVSDFKFWNTKKQDDDQEPQPVEHQPAPQKPWMKATNNNQEPEGNDDLPF